MKIGIDFDGCFRADPEAWKEAIDCFHAAGHECILVTKRHPDDEESVREVVNKVDGQMPLIFCGHNYKEDVVREQGIDIDVWIDDNPEFIRDKSRIKERLMEAKNKLFYARRRIKKLSHMLSEITDLFYSLLED